MKSRKNYFIFCLAFLGTLFFIYLPASTIANDYTVTVNGFFFGFDGFGQRTFPLKGARVVLMDSDADGSTLFDDEMGSSYVNDDGSFSVTGTGGDPGSFSWSKPDVYIRVYFNNDKGVRLTNELDWDRYAETPQHDHDNFEGTMDIGTWVTGTGAGNGEGTKPGVWIKATEVYDEYNKIMGANPPAGKYDVEYWSAIWAGTPWTNTNTTHWPIHYATRAVRHEFGHSIRHAFDGDADHFNWDVTRFRYARNHSMCDNDCNRIGTDTHDMGLAFGFNEGWAEFWAGESNGFCTSTIDDECEGNIAFALVNLSKVNGAGKKGLLKVLEAHPGQIHSLDEFTNYFALSTSVTRSALNAEIFKDKTLQKNKLDPFLFSVANYQREAVQKNIREANRILSSLKEQLSLAKNKAAVIKGCDSLDCYLAIETLIRPIILSTEISIKTLELQRMVKSLTGASIENYSSMLRRGTFDSMRLIEKTAYTNTVLRIETNAYKQILSSIGKLSSQSQTSKMLEADFQSKMDRFAAFTRKYKVIPPSSYSEFIFSEDVARVKQQ